ncbi:unnamed protein product [Acanthoscelides obtectus]|nr:unnamed protein product [Acanthoscelides obtectus]CAK1675746.1 Zinc finger Y-chromosomal protein [Acanthoscelides obtectus]
MRKCKEKGLGVVDADAVRELFVCYKCNYVANCTADLMSHLNEDKCESIESADLIMCEYCNASFVKAESLDDHIIKKHPDFIASVSRKIIQCPKCDFKSISKYKIRRHISGVHPGSKGNRNVCAHCSSTFKKPESLDDHIVKIHPTFMSSVNRKIYECTICPLKTIWKGKLEKHMTNVHLKSASVLSIPCTYCIKIFKSQQSLDEHIVKKHPDCCGSIVSKLHECSICPFKSTAKGRLEKHMMNVHPITASDLFIRCMHCEAVFKSKASLDDHVVKKHPDRSASVTRKILECPICPFKTIAKAKLESHTMIYHPNAATNLFIACMHCEDVFKSKELLDDHIVRKHPDFIAAVSRKIHQCPKCTFKTVKKYKIERHMTAAHPDSNTTMSVCAHCKSTFKKPESLDDHIIKTHPTFIESVKRKIHECTKCEFKTISKSSLERHMMGSHPKAASNLFVSCVHCDKVFKSKALLDDHIVKKHPDYSASVTRKIYECPICPYKSVRKTDSDKHMAIHPETAQL